MVGRVTSEEGAPRRRLPKKFRQVCSINVLVLANVGQVSIVWFFVGPVAAVPALSIASNVSTEAEMRSGRKRKRAIITRRFVLLVGNQSGPS